MALTDWTLYVATVLAFMATPGPSHLLMLSNSMSNGLNRSIATAAGDLTANALQMLAAGFGLAAFLVASQNALAVIKWAGAAYLIWMGIQMWRRAAANTGTYSTRARKSVRELWLQGFLTSAANPKAVVFFAALFPQFIRPELPFATQFFILSVTYLVIDGLFLISYGAGADYLARRMRGKASAVLDRVGGAFLVGAGLLLGLKTLRES